MNRSEQARPVCYLAIRDDKTRADLVAQLAHQGFEVIPKPTGFHLLDELSGCILGDHPRRVDWVIVEDPLPGCRGSSIAEGLAQLGLDIPVTVIDPRQPELRLAS